MAEDAGKVGTVDRILSAVTGLEKLVEDMLTYGQDIEPRRVLRPVAPLVEEALDLARAILEEKRITVKRDLEGAEAEIDGDMMRRVYLNIILNGAQAMEAGGTLTVSARGGEVTFTDTGAGIPPEIKEKLFTPFLTSKAKGTGLGLAIALKIVEAHGGTIQAENNPEGGATFKVQM